MKKIFPRTAAVILCAVLTLTLAGCFKINVVHRTSETSEVTTPSSTAQTTQAAPETSSGRNEETTSSGGSSTGSVTVPVWHEIDQASFMEKCSRLEELAGGNDSQALLSLYDELYALLGEIKDNTSAAYLAYSADVSDSVLSARNDEADTMETECTDALLTACLAVTKGPCAAAFKEHVGEYVFEAASEYEPMTEEELEISKRVTELCTSYYSIVDESEEAGLGDKAVMQKVGPIYLELVQLRTRLAEIYGYDSYADYAYKEVYAREYSIDDALAFGDIVKEYSPEVYTAFYDAYMRNYYYGGASDSLSLSEGLKYLKQYGENIDPVIGEAYKYMTENHLYDISGGSNRIQSNYTLDFPYIKVPYIFITLDGSNNFDTLTHEFGHFTHFTLDPTPDLLSGGIGDLDVAEIHSTGLEFLYAHYYPEIFGQSDGETLAENLVLNDFISCIVNGCLFNEFESEVYGNPDMTLDEINALYQRLCSEFGDPYTDSSDYWWVYVGHLFESPLYYISYAASTICSLQIWDISRTDFDKACDVWAQIVKTSYFEEDGYIEITESAGIAPLTDTEAVKNTLASVLAYSQSSDSSNPFQDIFDRLFG